LTSFRYTNIIISAGFFRFLYAVKCKLKIRITRPCGGKQIILEIPSLGESCCVSIRDIDLRGIQFSSFMRTLSVLQKRSYLRYGWYSRKKIIISLSYKGENLIRRIISNIPLRDFFRVDITKTDIKFLWLISYYGFLPSRRVLNRKLNISRQGLAKLIAKHIRIKTIDAEGLITETGEALLSLFGDFIHRFRQRAFLWKTSFNSLFFNHSMTHKEFQESIIATVDICKNVILQNQICDFIPRGFKLDIVGIDDTPNIFRIVRAFRKTLIAEGFNIDRALACRVDLRTDRMLQIRRALGADQSEIILDKRLSFLPDLLSREKSRVILLLTNPRFSNIFMEDLAQKVSGGSRIILINKVSRGMGMLTGMLSNIASESNRILEELYNAFRGKKKKIRMSWGVGGSFIEILPTRKIPPETFNKTITAMSGSLENSWCVVPFGALKINMGMLTRYSHVRGDLGIADEPIYGVRGLRSRWFKNSGGVIDIYKIKTKHKQVELETVSHTGRLPRYLHGSTLDTIYIGLNTVARGNIKTIAITEPFLFRYVKGFILMEIASFLRERMHTYSYVGSKLEIRINDTAIYPSKH